MLDVDKLIKDLEKKRIEAANEEGRYRAKNSDLTLVAIGIKMAYDNVLSMIKVTSSTE